MPALVDRTLREFGRKDIVPAGRVPGGRPHAGHARGGRRPATRRRRSGSTTRPPGHQPGTVLPASVRPGRRSSRELDAFRDPTYPFKAGDFALRRATHAGHRRPSCPTRSRIGQDAAVPVTSRARARSASATCCIDPAVGQVVSSGAADTGRGRRASFSVTPRCGRHRHPVPGPLPAVPRRDERRAWRSCRSAWWTWRSLPSRVRWRRWTPRCEGRHP